MKELVRTRVDEFSLENAIDIKELENSKENLQYITIEEIFNNSEKIDLDKRKLELLLNGVMLTVDKDDGIYRIYHQGKFIGIGIIKNRLLKRDVIV